MQFWTSFLLFNLHVPLSAQILVCVPFGWHELHVPHSHFIVQPPLGGPAAGPDATGPPPMPYRLKWVVFAHT